MIRRGDLRWAALPDPIGSEPGYRRPVVVVQADDFTASAIKTVMVAVVTSNVRLGAAPGNVALRPRDSGLRRNSVVNVSQVITIDKTLLGEKVRTLAAATMQRVDVGLRLALAL